MPAADVLSRRPVRLAALAVATFVLAEESERLAAPDGTVVAWLSIGLVAGVLRSWPAGRRPVVLLIVGLASALGAVTADLQPIDELFVGVATVAGALAYVAAHGALGGGPTPLPWDSRGSARLFLASAAAGAAAAIPGGLSMLVGGGHEISAGRALWTWFAAGTAGTLLVAPVASVLILVPREALGRRGPVEGVVAVLSVGITSTAVAWSELPLQFVTLALVAIAAVRLGPGGAALAALAAGVPELVGLAADHGEFAAAGGTTAILLTQAFLVAAALLAWVPGLVTGGLFASQAALADANADLAGRSAELGRAVAHVEALLDATRDVTVHVDAQGGVVSVRGGDPRLRATFSGDAAALRRLLALQPPEGTTAELVLPGEDGDLIAEARTADLATGGRVVLVSDVTERRRQEQALSAQAVELERSNAELAQFAYVASHDLREPLRQVAGFAELLGRAYRGRLDATADEYIDLVLAGVTRMNSLIRDLLALSELRREAVRLEPCDLAAIVEAIAQDEARRLEEIGGRLEVAGDLPVVAGDRTQLRQLLANLVGNAIKYRSSRPLVIRISAIVRDGRIVVHVADNGIGFEAAHASRIFGMFQRLHPRDVYEGTGIGLALCRRVVENHGGTIWADSAPAVGSVFTFTLRGRPLRASRA